MRVITGMLPQMRIVSRERRAGVGFALIATCVWWFVSCYAIIVDGQRSASSRAFAASLTAILVMTAHMMLSICCLSMPRVGPGRYLQIALMHVGAFAAWIIAYTTLTSVQDPATAALFWPVTYFATEAVFFLAYATIAGAAILVRERRTRARG